MSPTTPLVKVRLGNPFHDFHVYVEITYPLFVKGAAAKVPARNRNTKMEAAFCESAQPT
jgi:hypothetical protein